MARLSFRCDEELVARVDEARGMIPREAFLRRLVEGGITDPPGWLRSEWTKQSGGVYDSHPEVVAANRNASSEQAKRGTGPRPKGGK